ncbi:hypothetical protein SAMN04488564_103382 [Lentzea waywayandensis]|uniref:Uncharacterized protein n=1 Tax=Lentzea waywayandensis TaxID=84724 RepID=A0A1I6DY56_9PSEU|nr:hypothetical protein [Lentzea waywayandensis]SFR10363.1 hypothetical protein SAMN04488564_103382 [Lentzea waywayandensis]
MPTHQHEPGARPEDVANWAADTLDTGFGDGMGQAMKVLGEAIGMVVVGQANGRRVPLLEEDDNVFGLDCKAAPPVIGL